jgi:hypothetical protein
LKYTKIAKLILEMSLLSQGNTTSLLVNKLSY